MQCFVRLEVSPGELPTESVYNADGQVTANDVITGTVYDELANEPGYSSAADRPLPEVPAYSMLQSSTRELPQPPIVYDRLPRHDYVNAQRNNIIRVN